MLGKSRRHTHVEVVEQYERIEVAQRRVREHALQRGALTVDRGLAHEVLKDDRIAGGRRLGRALDRLCRRARLGLTPEDHGCRSETDERATPTEHRRSA